MNIPKSFDIKGKTKTILYAVPLLFLLSQCTPKNKEENNKNIFIETIDTTIISKDDIFDSLAFKVFVATPEQQPMINILQTANSYSELSDLIYDNSVIGKEFEKYLQKNNKNIGEMRTDVDMMGFLLSFGIAVDIEYNKNLGIRGIATISYEDIIKKFPSLDDISIKNKKPVTVINMDGSSNIDGCSLGNGVIVIMNNANNKNSIFLNELTGEIFKRYIDDIKLQHPDFIQENKVYLPIKTSDSVLSTILGKEVQSIQWNEYRGDLTNLAYDSSTHLEHMLLFGVMEEGMNRMNPSQQEPSIQGTEFIHQNFPSYILSKHTINKFLLSQSFLSSIPYNRGTLWEYYQTIRQKELQQQYHNNTIYIEGYQDIAKELTTIIKNNPQALQKIQQRATLEKNTLEQYLKSFQKR